MKTEFFITTFVEFRSSLPVVSGGPAAWFSKARERGAEEEVFRHCALVRVKKGTLNKVVIPFGSLSFFFAFLLL